MRGAAALIAALVAGAPLAPPVAAQGGAPRTAPAPLFLGPRLLDYPMECLDPRGCRIECFQNGVKVVSRTQISTRDDVKLIASATTDEAVTPRWIEIRPFNDSDVQTLLLTPDTFCDLRSLVISPKNRP